MDPEFLLFIKALKSEIPNCELDRSAWGDSYSLGNIENRVVIRLNGTVSFYKASQTGSGYEVVSTVDMFEPDVVEKIKEFLHG